MSQASDQMEERMAGADPAASKELMPLRFSDLIDLYTRPRRFFSAPRNIGAKKVLLPVVWLLGISAQIDRIDTEILRHEARAAGAVWRLVDPLVSGSWAMLWAYCLFVGIFSGAVIYWIGGWWYRLRLRWSGARKNLDNGLPRYVFCWSGLVMALPHVLLVLGFTFAFPSYLASHNSGEMISLVLPVFVFWSVAVSYVAAMETFAPTTWKALIWFLILPASFYLFVLGAVVFVLAWFS